MIHGLLSLILAVAASSGWSTTTGNPGATSQDSEHATNTPTPPTAEAGNDEDKTGTRTTTPDDQEQYVIFPAAGVKLVRPAGFSDAKSFDGFQQTSTQSSVMVITIPGPFSEVTSGLTAERLKTHGMHLKNEESVRIDGDTGVLVYATQTANETEFAKWILAFGDEKETRLITATFPKAREARLSGQLRLVLLSARLDVASPPTPRDDVGFTIVASKKMKASRSVGKTLAYTRDGVIPAKSPEEPLFIVGTSLSRVSIPDQRQFSVERLRQTAATKIGSVTATNTIASGLFRKSRHKCSCRGGIAYA